MSEIWSTFIDIHRSFEEQLDSSGIELYDPVLKESNQAGWSNRVWNSSKYRWAHISVIDTRKTTGMWIMQCCIIPHTHNSAPIYRFNVIAERDKITEFRHEFIPTSDANHSLINWFSSEVKLVECLLDNIQELDKLDVIFEIAEKSINYYLSVIENTSNTTTDTSDDQNYYLSTQTLNPITIQVLTHLGLDNNYIQSVINNCMFPTVSE
jgi:hypothetical protein